MPADLVDPGHRFEAWTNPNVTTFKRKFDLSRWVGYTVADKFGAISDGRLDLPTDFSKLAQLFKVDKANHANDVSSIIRQLDGTTPINHFVLKGLDDKWSSTSETLQGFLEGMDFFLDKALVPNFDAPVKPYVEPDWHYGLPSILHNSDFEDAGATNFRIHLWLESTVSAGTWDIEFDDGATADDVTLDWNDDITAVQTGIEGLSNITDISISGAGTEDNPWVIEVIAPGGTDYNVTIDNTSLVGGDALHLAQVQGGAGITDPWTRSFNPITGEFHGVYFNFEISTTQNHTPGGARSLYVKGALGAWPESYPGAQQIIGATGGRLYRDSVWVYPKFARRYRFGLRSTDETWIAEAEADLTANSWQEVKFPGLIPTHIRQVIFRVACISNTDGHEFYLDDALFAPGMDAATYGKIMGQLLAACQAAGFLTWVTKTWTDTHDSAGVAWDRLLVWSVKHRQSLLQLVEYADRWNYESDGIHWDITDSRFEWGLYNPSGGGANKQGTGMAVIGKVVSETGTMSKRIPDATQFYAEGDLGYWNEFSDATLDGAWGPLQRSFFNAQGLDTAGLLELATRLVADAGNRTDGLVTRLQAAPIKPWIDFKPGDRNVMVNLLPKRAREYLRCMAIVATKGRGDATPVYEAHWGSVVYQGEAAVLETVRRLVRKFEADRPVTAASDGQPVTPIPPPDTASGLDDSSWIFAASNSSPADQIRADQILAGSADQTAIHDAILAHLPEGGTVGFLPGTYLFNEPLTNSNASGSNTSLLFANPLRFRGSGGVVWRWAANPASSNFFIRFGGSVAGTYDDPPRIIFDGITFDASDGTPGVGWTNLDGVALYVGAGTLPPTLFTACVFRYFEGDWVFKGERKQSMQITSSFFLNCDPTDVFFNLGGFTDGNVIIHGNEFHNCDGVLDSGLGGHQGGMFYGNQIYNGTITWVGSAMHVFHNRISGTHYTGHHQGTSGVDLNLLADAKGDIIGATAADTWARLPVGTNKHALHAASAETTGLKWQLPGGRTTISGFTRENLAASLTASQLERSLSAALAAALPVVISHAGSIVGISVASTEARTAGTATFEVYKNGAATGLTAVLDGTNTTFAFGVQAIDLDTVAAGDRLDVRVTTTGTWTPTTADVEATIVLQYDPA